MRFFLLLISMLAVPANAAQAGSLHAAAEAQAQVPLEEPEQPAPGFGDAAGTAEGDDLEKLGERSATTLDQLFADLKRQSKPEAASRITRRIWALWNESGSASIDLLMARAGAAMKEDKNALALDLLDQVTTLAPDYAEGWNRRASVHYAMKNPGRSLGDIERALALEPRHFGALSGLALILQSIGREDKALETWLRVLDLNPADRNAQEQVIKLEEKLTGNPA